MDRFQFLSVQGHWGRWARSVISNCESSCTGHQTRQVIPTHRVLKYFKNKSQQVIATNHWRNEKLEDKPASMTMSKRQEQQKNSYSVPSRRDSSTSSLPPGIWSEEKWLLDLWCVRFVLIQNVLQTLTHYLPLIPSLCQNCRYTAPVA